MFKKLTFFVTWACICLGSSLTFAANIVKIDPAYPTVLNGSTFKVRVTISGALYTGSHCITIELKATGGFSPALASKYISHLSSGSSKTVEFTLRAPSYNSSSLLTVKTKWSNLYSCSGTYLSSTRSMSISCNAGWTVSAELLNPGCILYGEPTVWSLTNSWRYSDVKTAASPPYRVTFKVPAVPSYYTLGAQWWCLGPFASKYPKGKQTTIYVSSSGKIVRF